MNQNIKVAPEAPIAVTTVTFHKNGEVTVTTNTNDLQASIYSLGQAVALLCQKMKELETKQNKIQVAPVGMINRLLN